MPSSEVILGLGSNQSFRGKSSFTILEEALFALEKILTGLRRSSFYETEAQGVKDQGSFLNCAAIGFYSGRAGELLEEVHAIESFFGRNRAFERRWGERPLDIDILLFGDLVVCDPPFLLIPHPELKKRRFALEPLLELSPDAKEPCTGIPYKSACDALPPQGVIRLANPACYQQATEIRE
ncbi:MAG: 2-amino-4-hydroxy-6-hydroxymethyldihydropteridine diphosphokinase [Treponema sp.]|jgi:2-amino-4-hydroxy-6-hydroxymethyldihydropteridine diphosphokinase|nr:2-amino-4-hydroxy-6-hydroxymethyldihydropteridine diphosphokinase [Treponema sp.]